MLLYSRALCVWIEISNETRRYPVEGNRSITFCFFLMSHHIDVIKTHLESVDSACGRTNRIYAARVLFEYICLNRTWLLQHPRLCRVINQKLIEMHMQEEWGEAAWYHYRLFGPNRNALVGRL